MAAQAHPNFNEKLTKILAGMTHSAPSICSCSSPLLRAEMGGIEKSNGVVHKAKAYQKAVQALKVCVQLLLLLLSLHTAKITDKAYPKAITSGAEAQKELDGVGKKIAKKIDEILATGSLKKLEKHHADPRQMAISLFSKV